MRRGLNRIPIWPSVNMRVQRTSCSLNVVFTHHYADGEDNVLNAEKPRPAVPCRLTTHGPRKDMLGTSNDMFYHADHSDAIAGHGRIRCAIHAMLNAPHPELTASRACWLHCIFSSLKCFVCSGRAAHTKETVHDTAHHLGFGP